jgi:endonuclease-3 related protein
MTAAPQKAKAAPEALVRAIYRKLERAWGRQHWWPAETPFEVIVGAILTQNTSWTNVERAMASLRAAGALSIEGIRSLPLAELQQLVRSSGYYRQKSDRLKVFVRFLDEKHSGSLDTMFATPTAELREQLLSLKGIGRETADAILLYGGSHEMFVVDTYTHRILGRHAVVDNRAKYDEVRQLVERSLHRIVPKNRKSRNRIPPKLQVHSPSAMSTGERSPTAQLYNEMHGLLVQIGKHYCYKQRPNCEECPLLSLLPDGAAMSLIGQK